MQFPLQAFIAVSAENPWTYVVFGLIGFAFGFITAFSNLGNLVGPAVTGAVHDRTGGWSHAWLALACCALVGALMCLVIALRENRAAAPSE